MSLLGRVAVAVALFATACAVPPTGSIALDDRAIVEAGGELLIPVLLNDRAPQGETLTVTELASSAGSVRITDDGQLEYVATEGFSGEDRFTYTVVSGSGSEASATVFVSVGAAGPTTVTTAPLPTATEQQPDSLVIATGPQVDFGEVYVSQTVEVRVAFVAKRGNFAIQATEQGEIRLEPDSDCQPLEEGRSCEATVTWSASTPGLLEEDLAVSEGVSLRVVGSVVHALRFDPQEQLVEAPAVAVDGGRVGVFRVTLKNVSDQTVELGTIELVGEFAGASIDRRRCDEILDGTTLRGGDRCVVSASVDLSDAVPGQILEGAIVVSYAGTRVNALVSMQVPSIMSPVWTRPVPGQGIWRNVVRGGFTVAWDVEPSATSYELTARICWDGESGCTDLWTSDPQPSPVGSVAVIDPASFEAFYQAALDGGLTPVLVLAATATGIAADGSPTVSDLSELRLAVENAPFELRELFYEPSPPASLSCEQTVFISLTVRSFLLDKAPFEGRPWGNGVEPFRSSVTMASVAPAADTTAAEVSFVAVGSPIDQIRFYLDGDWGASMPVDYEVESCIE